MGDIELQEEPNDQDNTMPPDRTRGNMAITTRITIGKDQTKHPMADQIRRKRKKGVEPGMISPVTAIKRRPTFPASPAFEWNRMWQKGRGIYIT